MLSRRDDELSCSLVCCMGWCGLGLAVAGSAGASAAGAGILDALGYDGYDAQQMAGDGALGSLITAGIGLVLACCAVGFALTCCSEGGSASDMLSGETYRSNPKKSTIGTLLLISGIEAFSTFMGGLALGRTEHGKQLAAGALGTVAIMGFCSAFYTAIKCCSCKCDSKGIFSTARTNGGGGGGGSYQPPAPV